MDAGIFGFPENAAALLNVLGQRLKIGFRLLPYSNGVLPAVFQPDPAFGQEQLAINNSALQINAPAFDGVVELWITNGASAGAVSFSGFTVSASTGDSLTTTNGNKFIISIRVAGGVATYLIKALQ
jgi:hypothetical protein